MVGTNSSMSVKIISIQQISPIFSGKENVRSFASIICLIDALSGVAEINQKLFKIVKMYFIQNLSTFIYLLTFYLKTKCKQNQVIKMMSSKSRRGINKADI